MNTTLLDIKKLNANIEDNKIIKDLSLSIKKGEIHVIMGPPHRSSPQLQFSAHWVYACSFFHPTP